MYAHSPLYCIRGNIGENKCLVKHKAKHIGRLNIGDLIKLYFVCTHAGDGVGYGNVSVQ